ncbi:MAG TPA: glycosyltransferase family 4 protein [Burkholderiales bacterium]|jgi:UDP-N-acetylmuramyl pentapeptide phosphotransferase/UDP-N-acetylglucosamine-1-phosphate transferase|nr:glycosyltransferase family 4 protein [Burkholderiales bacterium]
MQFVYPIATFLATVVLLGILLRSNVFAKIQDIPNQRSLHQQPIPRTGGLALMAGLGLSAIFQPTLFSWYFFAPVFLLVLVSLVDDISGVSPKWRLLIHMVAAGVFIAGALYSSGASVGVLILIGLAVVWMINLYNFMDGSDGLAGGMALFGFSVYGAAGWIAGDNEIAIFAFSIAAAALAFLLFNFHPAKIFLGDTGSIPLGFFAASLGLIGWQRQDWPFWFPLLVFSPFIMDASATLLRRLLRGERVWEAHRGHYYQRLVQSGFGHRNTALLEYALMMASGVSALWAAHAGSEIQILVLAAWAILYGALALLTDRRWKKYSRLQGPLNDESH